MKMKSENLFPLKNIKDTILTTFAFINLFADNVCSLLLPAINVFNKPFLLHVSTITNHELKLILMCYYALYINSQ